MGHNSLSMYFSLLYTTLTHYSKVCVQWHSPCYISPCLYTQSEGGDSEMLHNLPTKEVPKELIISSKSIRLLDAVSQGTLLCI